LLISFPIRTQIVRRRLTYRSQLWWINTSRNNMSNLRWTMQVIFTELTKIKNNKKSKRNVRMAEWVREWEILKWIFLTQWFIFYRNLKYSDRMEHYSPPLTWPITFDHMAINFDCLGDIFWLLTCSL
jgi:hypothetical protein